MWSVSDALSGAPEARRCRSVSTLEQFHDQERPLIAIDAEIVDADDVRMGKAGGRTRFLSKAATEVKRSDDVFPDQLHRDRTFEDVVHGGVDRAHAAAAEAALEAVAAVEQPRSSGRRQWLMIVRAQLCARVEASSAAFALGQRVPIARRPLQQQSDRVRDGHQKIEILLVVRFLRTSRTEHQQAEWQIARELAGDGHEQLDAPIDEQRAFLDRELMPHPRRIAE